jgi:hypothetical protein
VIQLARKGHRRIEDREAIATSVNTMSKDAEGVWKTMKLLGLLIAVSLSPERPAQQQMQGSNPQSWCKNMREIARRAITLGLCTPV